MIGTNDKSNKNWLERSIIPDVPALTFERLIFAGIILLMIISRLYDLSTRVMSHDESVHVYYSWLYSIGQGYQHTPSTHGPLQFNLIAFTFLLFQDSDFTARLPHAIAAILTVVLLWKWRRYLGKAGTLVAAAFMLISPYMLYYGRYARNEVFVALLGVVTLYAILRFLETGKNQYLVLLTVATALHFTVKETAFIYTAQAILFLVIYLFNRVMHSPWRKNSLVNAFIATLSASIFFLVTGLSLQLFNNPQSPASSGKASVTTIGHTSPGLFLLALGVIIYILSIIFLFFGFGWKNLRSERSLAMLVILGTFVLPQLAAFPVQAFGWNPLDYIFTWPGWNFQALWSQGPVRTGFVLLILVLLSILIGLIWDWKRWLINSAIFWGIYTIFYTSIFSNWAGLATGIVGSLGYWLEQQGVHRGSQPWYYYLLIQIPVYEFLPALGAAVAVYFGLRKSSPAVLTTDDYISSKDTRISIQGNASGETAPIFNLLVWWTVTSLLAFSIAGEKMPWLTVHMVLPMFLLAGWGLGQVIERFDWSRLTGKGGWVTILVIVFILSLLGCMLSLLGTNPPFQGKSLVQLSITGMFLFMLVALLGSGIGLIVSMDSWPWRHLARLAVMVFFSLLAVQTVRTAVRAAYIDPNDATEFLVYAHGASGVKDVMQQVDNISFQTTGGDDLSLAYDTSSPDSGVAWPFTWYLRHYPNKTSFDEPGLVPQGVPVILVDQKNFESIKPFIGSDYYSVIYNRMVWPNQDYFDLDWSRIKGAITDPRLRASIWEIWLNRDFSLYAKTTNNTNLTTADWSPSDRMELLLRRDIAASLWNYGILLPASTQTDPYAKGKISLPVDLLVGLSGSGDGELNSPHGIAVVPDGSLFVADTDNNRIQHFSADGRFINTWGTFGDAVAGVAPIGTFNQPFDLAVSQDGKFVYVADTWNHRIQKFSSDGTTIKMWGNPHFDPTATDPYGLWGPRGIAVDSMGHVIVIDTGNKRVVVYDADGNFITQIGSEGVSAGQFEEPVGVAVDSQNRLYIADTWNQRIQVFKQDQGASTYSISSQWDIAGWYSQSLDNKPYLAIDHNGHIFATDPESFRVIEFTSSGEFIRTWGDYGTGLAGFGLPSAVAVDSQGHIWVSDAVNDHLLRFSAP